MEPEDILRDLAAGYWSIGSEGIRCLPFGKGASGRFLCRLFNEDTSLVGVHWNFVREDNDSFVAAARHLKREGVAVPEIEYYEKVNNREGRCVGGVALVQDLGDIDLLSFKDSPWKQKKELYVQTLRELKKLHSSSPGYDRIQAPFDEEMYRWEQMYFAEHFLGRHLGWNDWKDVPNMPELDLICRELLTYPRSLVHRDFQSQNVMLWGGKVWLIDFQGMRLGRPEYDVASLLYDPYAELTRGERAELLIEWEQITGEKVDERIYQLCSFQRLMQVLGAYANIGYNTGVKWYLDRIPTAVSSLSELLSITKLAEPLRIRLG